MGKKIFFQDGSAIEISTEILEPGEMATAAYRKVLEFITDELVEVIDPGDEDLSDLSEPNLEALEDSDLELDDDDLSLDDDWNDDLLAALRQLDHLVVSSADDALFTFNRPLPR